MPDISEPRPETECAADCETEAREHADTAENQESDVRPLGAKRHADPELPRPLPTA